MSLEQDIYTLAGGRKERVLHARIPPALDQALKQHARRRHVPVSRLIRDLLADAISREVEPDGLAPLGWQNIQLSASTVCQGCSKDLPALGDAFVAIYGRTSAPKIICQDCKTRNTL